jgi:transketolase
MTGIAAGLALEGHTVFTYSIANFPTLRCLEQIRNDVLYHNLPVNVVAVGGGFSYGALGMSHHATEDVAILRALPNLRIFTPCNIQETQEAVVEMVEDPHPSYIRIDKSMVSSLSSPLSPASHIRKLRQGKKVAILGCGGVLGEAERAAAELAQQDIDCSIYSISCLKPLNSEDLISILESHDSIITLEEHSIIGGLGSIVSEILIDSDIRPAGFLRLALPDAYSSIVGSQEYLRSAYGLDGKSIANRIQGICQ